MKIQRAMSLIKNNLDTLPEYDTSLFLTKDRDHLTEAKRDSLELGDLGLVYKQDSSIIAETVQEEPLQDGLSSESSGVEISDLGYKKPRSKGNKKTTRQTLLHDSDEEGDKN